MTLLVSQSVYEEHQVLIDQISEIQKITSSQWLANLEPRKLAELEFHNRERDPAFQEEVKAQDTFEKFYGNKKFYSTTNRSRNFVDSWIRDNSAGKVVLDYACGNGETAIRASSYGASLVLGFDISDQSISNCNSSISELGIENCVFFQADAENTRLPDCCVDTIICSGMLHHLDLSFAFPELRRILKPGGKILAVEALDYNPFIKLYRMLTPDLRTEWEKAHILSLNDLEFASRFFDVTDIRYWHVIGYIGAMLPSVAPVLDFADRTLEKVPYVNRLSWTFTFELTKVE